MEPRNAKEEYLSRQAQRLMPHLPSAAVRLRVLDVFRADLFRGLLADAILHRLRPAAARQEGVPPAAIAILLSRFSTKAVELARQYIAAFCPSLDWLVMDVKGRASYSLQGQVQERRVEPFRHEPLGEGFATPKRLFSPNNQWFLKVVLLAGMDSRYWGGPVQSRINGVSDLARLAGKPQPSASTFWQVAEEQGWLSRESEGFVMHRVSKLLELWSYHLHNNPDRALPVASIYPGEGAEELLQRLRGAEDVVISGHYGAYALGLGIASVRTLRVYVRDLDASLQRFSLAKAPADRAVAILAQPRAADAVFKGAVAAGNGLRLADIVQIHLDVRASMARGEEQADHIYERVLAPYLRERQWL
jgi:hypothetical protein